MKEVDREFGKFVREKRKQAGLTQGQLAKMIGIKQTTLCGIENGNFNAGGAVRQTIQQLFSASPSAGTDPIQPEPCSASEHILMDEIRSAREELGYPMLDIETAAWDKASPKELLAESVLLREALELRASRELLAGAQAFRKKREAARDGK